MVIVQKRSKRKPSGARYKLAPPKRLHQRGNASADTTIGDERKKVVRMKGGSEKNRLLAAKVVNVLDPAKKKQVKAEIETVVENSANRNYVRRNIITKGSVVTTNIGKVKITNRPGQEGTLNGVVVQE